jgi:hypothetical protein
MTISAVIYRGHSYKVPRNHAFSRVTITAERIINDSLKCYFAKDYDGCNHLQSVYAQFLNGCNWTDAKYNREMLRRIDRRWQ